MECAQVHEEAALEIADYARREPKPGRPLRFGRSEEELAPIDDGVLRDASNALELRDRCLELFNVASKQGVPEIWLLGQRLFPPAT